MSEGMSDLDVMVWDWGLWGLGLQDRAAAPKTCLASGSIRQKLRLFFRRGAVAAAAHTPHRVGVLLVWTRASMQIHVSQKFEAFERMPFCK